MNRFFKSITMVCVGACLCVSSLSACTGANRNDRLNNGALQRQGRNMTGDNKLGMNPNTDPRGTNLQGQRLNTELDDNRLDNNGMGNTRLDGNQLGNNGLGDNLLGNNRLGDNRQNDLALRPNPGTAGLMQMNQQQITDGRMKADRIKAQLANMNDIRNANVVVVGNTALVGFNTTTADVDPVRARDMVISKVKQADNSITNVLTTNAQDVLMSIGRLSDDITHNRPVNSIQNDFNQIVRSINPINR